MSLHLYNTLTRRKEAFAPIDPGHVRMYVCGPTVYQRIHIGNARPLIVFDVLYRLLRHAFPKVTYVRNITDVDDKIIKEARLEKVGIDTLTERTAEAFRQDALTLGCLPPDAEPRATKHIPDMVALIERLIERGHAYEAEGHVLFNVPSMPDYGQLSGRSRDDQIAGARVEVAPFKRDPADFVLWKPAADDEPGWDSPWGRGRPGWHIECSAMAETILGVPFDIHGGGVDLTFPHHENEIAQSCCAHGIERMANYWLHNGFVDMRGEKMSKSTGNVLRMDTALEQHDAEAIRLWMLGTHYRQPVEYSEKNLGRAEELLRRMYGALASVEDVPENGAVDAKLLAALEDDLNTPLALARLHEMRAALRTETDEARRRALAGSLKASAALLGLLQSKEALEHGRAQQAGGVDSALAGLEPEQRDAIRTLVERRMEARRAKDFALADQLRDEIAALGFVIEDTAGEPKLRPIR